jgi:hypothetical protein
MPSYNSSFEINMEELVLIETALNFRKDDLAKTASDPGSDQSNEARAIYELLGRLHNQKTFYRPKNETYISG